MIVMADADLDRAVDGAVRAFALLDKAKAVRPPAAYLSTAA